MLGYTGRGCPQGRPSWSIAPGDARRGHPFATSRQPISAGRPLGIGLPGHGQVKVDRGTVGAWRGERLGEHRETVWPRRWQVERIAGPSGCPASDRCPESRKRIRVCGVDVDGVERDLRSGHVVVMRCNTCPRPQPEVCDLGCRMTSAHRSRAPAWRSRRPHAPRGRRRRQRFRPREGGRRAAQSG